MTGRHPEHSDRELLTALRRLADETIVPPPDAGREAALLAAFDARQSHPRRTAAAYWWMTCIATAALALIVFGIAPVRKARRELPSRPVAVGEFVPWPGSQDLPPLESGELMRIDLPVSMLPTLGMAPPPSHGTAVKADVVVGQDGLARAVRLVTN